MNIFCPQTVGKHFCVGDSETVIPLLTPTLAPACFTRSLSQYSEPCWVLSTINAKNVTQGILHHQVLHISSVQHLQALCL